MRKYNISANLTWVIKHLYDKPTSAVLFSGSIGDWLWTTVGVILSPSLCNIFLERIMTDVFDGHEGTVSIGGRTITNLCFADNIDCSAGEQEELAKLFEHLCKAFTAYGMEISAEKTKLMTNNTNNQWHQQRDQSKWTDAWDWHKLQVNGLSYNRGGFQAWDTLQDSTDNSSIDKVETSLEWQEYFSQFQDMTDTFPCHIHLPVCLWIMDPHSRAPKNNTSHVNEVLPHDTMHLI